MPMLQVLTVPQCLSPAPSVLGRQGFRLLLFRNLLLHISDISNVYTMQLLAIKGLGEDVSDDTKDLIIVAPG